MYSEPYRLSPHIVWKRLLTQHQTKHQHWGKHYVLDHDLDVKVIIWRVNMTGKDCAEAINLVNFSVAAVPWNSVWVLESITLVQIQQIQSSSKVWKTSPECLRERSNVKVWWSPVTWLSLSPSSTPQSQEKHIVCNLVNICNSILPHIHAKVMCMILSGSKHTKSKLHLTKELTELYNLQFYISNTTVTLRQLQGHWKWHA